jgi:predicted nucleic-acid-binding protein
VTTYSSTRPTQTPLCSRNLARIEHAILFCCLVPIACGSTLADDGKDPKGQPPGKGHSVVRDESSQSFEEHESESMEFVQSHHPELVALLQRLKSMKRDEYETAIRDLVKVRKRLETLEKRDSKLHVVELDAWKLQSKIDLLLARAVALDKEFDSSSLRTLVQKRIENQKERLELELANLLERQKQIRESLERLEGNEEERISQQLSALMKRVDSKRVKSGKNKPTKKDP